MAGAGEVELFRRKNLVMIWANTRGYARILQSNRMFFWRNLANIRCHISILFDSLSGTICNLRYQVQILFDGYFANFVSSMAYVYRNRTISF